MAQIYNPWNYSGTESVLEDGLATPVYQEQADAVEDAAEMPDEAPDMEAESGDGGEHGAMTDHMSAALATIQQQAGVINQLMAMLTGNSR